MPAVVRGGDPTQGWSVATARGAREFAVGPVVRLSSPIMNRDAVRCGAGPARLPLTPVSRDIAAGRMVHWGDVAGSNIAWWVPYTTRRLLNARVSAFLDLLRRAFRQGAREELSAFLEG